MSRIAAAALALVAAAPCWALEPTDVLSALARVERSDASFEETRHIAALTAPVVRRGTLRYVRPAELEMVVDTPVREVIRVAGPSLVIEAARPGPRDTPDRNAGDRGLGRERSLHARRRPARVVALLHRARERRCGALAARAHPAVRASSPPS